MTNQNFKLGDMVEATKDFGVNISRYSEVKILKDTKGLIIQTMPRDWFMVRWESGVYLDGDKKVVSSWVYGQGLNDIKLVRKSQLRVDEYINEKGEIRRKPEKKGNCSICGGVMKNIKHSSWGYGAHSTSHFVDKCEHCGHETSQTWD